MSDSTDSEQEGSVTRRTVLRVAAAGASVAAVGPVTARTQDGSGDGGGSDNLVVGLSEEAGSADRVADANTPAGTDIVKKNETLGYVVVSPPEEATAAGMAETLSARDEIRYVQPEYQDTIMSSQSSSAGDDPDDDLFDGQYAPQQVNAPDAWETTLGSEDVTIGILDQGVKYDHEDLEANMIDERVVENHGKDFVDDDGDPYPEIFTRDGGGLINPEIHGTAVAGIAGADTDTGVGVGGISDCSLLAGRVGNILGQIATTDGAEGIQWAADKGADVINLSFGGERPEEDFPDPVYQDALDYARDQGVLCIASAGNGGEQTERISPAAQENCMAVSALTDAEELAAFSSFGNYVDIAAPGTEEADGPQTTWPVDPDDPDGPADEYGRFAGTSMAAPVVSGVAGLVLSVDDSLSPGALQDLLEETATDVGLDDTEQGAGQVDAAGAVEEALAQVFNVETGEAADVEPTTATLQGTANNVDGEVGAGFLYRPEGTDDTTLTSGMTLTADGTFEEEIDGLDPETTYEFQALGSTSGEIVEGEWVTFETGPAEFDVETGDATDVGSTTATLRGDVLWLAEGDEAIVAFDYRPTGADDYQQTETEQRSTYGPVQRQVEGLDPGTTYEFRLSAGIVDGGLGDLRFGDLVTVTTDD
jgi:serine protease